MFNLNSAFDSIFGGSKMGGKPGNQNTPGRNDSEQGEIKRKSDVEKEQKQGDGKTPIGDKGLDSVITGLFTSLFQDQNKGLNGVSSFGDFDPFSYVDGNLQNAMKGDNKGIMKILGSIFGGGAG